MKSAVKYEISEGVVGLSAAVISREGVVLGGTVDCRREIQLAPKNAQGDKRKMQVIAIV